MIELTYDQVVLISNHMALFYGILVGVILAATMIWKFIDDSEELKFHKIIEYFGKYLGYKFNDRYPGNPEGTYRYIHKKGFSCDALWSIVLLFGLLITWAIFPILYLIFENIILFSVIISAWCMIILARFVLRLYKKVNIHIENTKIHKK